MTYLQRIAVLGRSPREQKRVSPLRAINTFLGLFPQSKRTARLIKDLNFWKGQTVYGSTGGLIGHIELLSVLPAGERLEIAVKGWLFGLDELVEDLTVAADFGEGDRTVYGIERPDVHYTFPYLESARRCGFFGLSHADSLSACRRMTFLAVLADKRRVSGHFGPPDKIFPPLAAAAMGEESAASWGDFHRLRLRPAPDVLVIADSYAALLHCVEAKKRELSGFEAPLFFTYGAGLSAEPDSVRFSGKNSPIFPLHGSEGLQLVLSLYKREARRIVVWGKEIRENILQDSWCLPASPAGAPVVAYAADSGAEIHEDFRPEFIVVHHSATDAASSVEDIRAAHLKRGWEDIGYHYLIDARGVVRLGRSPFRQGAHALGFNHRSLGVCCIGDFERTLPSERTRKALIALLTQLCSSHAIDPAHILCHSEVGRYVDQEIRRTLCPGKCLTDAMAGIREAVGKQAGRSARVLPLKQRERSSKT